MLLSQPLSQAVVQAWIQVLSLCCISSRDEPACVFTTMLQTLLKLLITYIYVLLSFWLPITWQTAKHTTNACSVTKWKSCNKGGQPCRTEQDCCDVKRKRQPSELEACQPRCQVEVQRPLLAHQTCFSRVAGWSMQWGESECSQKSYNEAAAEVAKVDMETCWDICYTQNCQGLVKDQMQILDEQEWQ